MSIFWSAAAMHFAKGTPFGVENFMYLDRKVDLTLAATLIPYNKNSTYELKNEGEFVIIEATSPFMLFVREVKQQPYNKRITVLMNQRFFNPDDRHFYEDDGTQVEKEVKEFVRRRPYSVQTLITNTSGNNLELQVLVDIPKGSIPLESHEYTQIKSITLSPYTTESVERKFYFPEVGKYKFYPANACKGNEIIAKAGSMQEILVAEAESGGSMETFEDVLKSGSKENILEYVRTKNIFDSKIFKANSILWMMKDKEFFK